MHAAVNYSELLIENYLLCILILEVTYHEKFKLGCHTHLNTLKQTPNRRTVNILLRI